MGPNIMKKNDWLVINVAEEAVILSMSPKAKVKEEEGEIGSSSCR